MAVSTDSTAQFSTGLLSRLLNPLLEVDKELFITHFPSNVQSVAFAKPPGLPTVLPSCN